VFRSRLMAPLAAVAVVALLSGPAAAHDHEPPKTELVMQGQHQPGRPGNFCWVRPSGDGFIFFCVDVIPGYPPSLRVPHGGEARITLRKESRPQDVALGYYRRVNEFNEPQGRRHEVPIELVPASTSRGDVWRVLFRLPDREGPYYLDLFATWPDEEGGEMLQDAAWTFLVEVGP
jgi:hypothetical protein